MGFGSFAFLPKAFLGVDIGTTAIKAVEVSGWGGKRVLKNYGELQSSNLYEAPIRSFQQNTLLLSPQEVAKAIRAVTIEANMKTRKAVFSLPDFSTFFTNLELPPMTRQELPEAVEYEARRHVPVPLSEVVFDWEVIGKPKEEEDPYRILLVAVPNEVVNQYQQIARYSKLELKAMEAEVFSLMRSCITPKDRRAILLDVGAQSTTISLIERGSLLSSHSFDVAGNSFSERIVSSLGVGWEEAEEMKYREGVYILAGKMQVLAPLIDQIIWEMHKLMQNFYPKEEDHVEKILLVGGAAYMPGFGDYLEENYQKIAVSSAKDAQQQGRERVQVANPFHSLFYPPVLEEDLALLGPSYAVAVGAALRGFDV